MYLHSFIHPSSHFYINLTAFIKSFIKFNKMLHAHSFVQSIAHINDSGTFETSFEVKYIQSTPQRQKNCRRHLNEFDRENLRRFVREFEESQAYNSSAKSTPKKFKTLSHNIVNIGNTNIRSLLQTPVCPRDNLHEHFQTPSPSCTPLSSRSSSPLLQELNEMGCKPLACCDNDEQSEEDNARLTSTYDLANSSAESTFDMHPPLLPLFNVTPPPKQQRQQQQRNAAYELAKFLRGSFHVKRAKITQLRRSLSENENLQNIDLHPTQLRTSKTTEMALTTEKAQKKKTILEDTTNKGVRGSTSSICVSILFLLII